MIKIKITGSTGFVGVNLMKHLIAKSYQSESLNRRNPNWKSEIDFDSNAIIHLAGKAQN